MRNLLRSASVLAVLCGVSRAHGQLVERFDYPDGGLTSRSGGAWERWGATTGDAPVVGGAARVDNATDVVRFFPSVLTQSGAARVSFDININEGNTSENYSVGFGPASSPGESDTNWAGGSIILRFDPLAVAESGRTHVTLFENEVNTHPRFTSISTGVTHYFRLELARAASLVNYSLFIDEARVLSSSFTFTDPRGLNAVDLWCYTDGTANPGQLPDAYATIDNIMIVPEPGVMPILCAAVMLLRGRRSPGLTRRCEGAGKLQSPPISDDISSSTSPSSTT
jgi:hypothetical protein